MACAKIAKALVFISFAFSVLIICHSPAATPHDTPMASFWAWMLVHVTGLDGGGDIARLRAHRAAESAYAGAPPQRGDWRPLQEEDAAALNASRFRARYAVRRLPVVLRGFLDAHAGGGGDEPLHRKWALRRLRDRFRDVGVLVKRDQRSLATLQRTTFGDYASAILEHKGAEGRTDFLAPTNELFHADPRMEVEAARVLDAVYELRGTPRHSFTTRLHTANDKPFYFFTSQGGRFTPLHSDATTTFFVQLEGRKQFWLLPPDQTPYLYPRGDPLNFAYFSAVDDPTPAWGNADGGGDDGGSLPPLIQRAGGFFVTLEPGDLLYWPSFFWHSVHSIDDGDGAPVSAFSVPAIVDVGGTFAANPILATGFLLNPKVLANFVWGWATNQAGYLRSTYFRAATADREEL